MSKGYQLLRPLGLSFRSKERHPVHVSKGQARVAILNAGGALLQERVGLLSKDGAQCEVLFEGAYRQAELVSGRWQYVVVPEPTPEVP